MELRRSEADEARRKLNTLERDRDRLDQQVPRSVFFFSVADRRIRMFLGLMDPDPLVKDTDPDSSIIKQK